MKHIFVEDEIKDIVIQKLLSRRDLLLVVPGSLLCLRSVYIKALSLDCVNRLALVPVTEEDYILGTAEEKIQEIIRRKGKQNGVKIIVVYLSCPDILIRIHFDYIERELSKEIGCIVKCFFRGPLGNREGAREERAKELLSVFPVENECGIENDAELPPPVSDVAGISDWLRRSHYANALVSTVGCRNCLRFSDMDRKQKDVYYTETTDQDVIFGFEDTVETQVNELYEKKDYKGIHLITSVVPALVGYQGDFLEGDGRSSLFYADGFHDAISGVAEAQRKVIKKAAAHYKGVGKYIEVVGYSRLLCGGKKQFEPFISFFQQMGYEVVFSGIDEERQEAPALSWMVSSAGYTASHWLYTQLGIPYVSTFPWDCEGRLLWEKKVKNLLSGNLEEKEDDIVYRVFRGQKKLKVLIIGDPVSTLGMAEYVRRKGFEDIKLAAYAWTKQTEHIYSSISKATDIYIFKNREELFPLWQEADLVIADELIAKVMPKKSVIFYPWGFISGRKGGDNLMMITRGEDFMVNIE